MHDELFDTIKQHWQALLKMETGSILTIEKRLSRAAGFLNDPTCDAIAPPFLTWRMNPEGPVHCVPIRGRILLGRDSSCDIVLPVAEISRKHARIEEDAEGIHLWDLESLNGTRVNNRYVSYTRLHSGDIVEMCNVELTVVGRPPLI